MAKTYRPRGEYATVATPSSRQVFNRSISGFSISIANGEYSICTASMWWTLQARRRVSEEISLRPRYLILPALCVTNCQYIQLGLIEGGGREGTQRTSSTLPWPSPSSQSASSYPPYDNNTNQSC